MHDEIRVFRNTTEDKTPSCAEETGWQYDDGFIAPRDVQDWNGKWTESRRKGLKQGTKNAVISGPRYTFQFDQLQTTPHRSNSIGNYDPTCREERRHFRLGLLTKLVLDCLCEEKRIAHKVTRSAVLEYGGYLIVKRWGKAIKRIGKRRRGAAWKWEKTDIITRMVYGTEFGVKPLSNAASVNFDARTWMWKGYEECAQQLKASIASMLRLGIHLALLDIINNHPGIIPSNRQKQWKTKTEKKVAEFDRKIQDLDVLLNLLENNEPPDENGSEKGV